MRVALRKQPESGPNSAEPRRAARDSVERSSCTKPNVHSGAAGLTLSFASGTCGETGPRPAGPRHQPPNIAHPVPRRRPRLPMRLWPPHSSTPSALRTPRGSSGMWGPGRSSRTMCSAAHSSMRLTWARWSFPSAARFSPDTRLHRTLCASCAGRSCVWTPPELDLKVTPKWQLVPCRSKFR